MNKQNKAGEPAREVRVAVACTGASGEPEMPVFTVRVTDLEFDHGQHYLKAQEMAEDDRYEGPFVCFDDHEQGPIHRAAAELASNNPVSQELGPSAVVRIKGGAVVDVICNVPLDVVIANYDVEGRDVNGLPELPSLVEDEGDETVYVPADCQTPQVFEDPAFTESLVRTARGIFHGDCSRDAIGKLQTFTVFVQQADGRGTVHISAHQAATREAAVRAAIADTLEDWDWLEHGEESVHVLGVAAGDVDILAWDDLDF